MFVCVLLPVSGSIFTSLDLSYVHTDSIYIRSNGLVEGTDGILSADNVTYTFVGDINGSLIVERDSILINGANHSLAVAYGSVGIDLQSRFNVTIGNLSLTGSYVCIRLNLCSSVIISGNRIATAHIGRGIIIQDSSGNIVSGNQIEENAEAIRMRGNSCYNRITENNLTNNLYGLTLNCPDNEVSRNSIAYHSICGFYAFSTNNITITANNVISNKNQSEHGAWGILMHGCNNSLVVGNNFADNEIAFEMHYSCNNTISGNSVVRSVGPFHFDGSGHNVYGNSFLNNTNYGLIAALVTNCTISGNNFDGNTVVGINVDEGQNITIAENIITNTQKDITNRASPIELLNLSRSFVSRNNMSNNADALKIHLCTDSVFNGNNIANNYGPGFYISKSENCIFSENHLLNNSNAGIEIWYSNKSSFVDNKVEGCGIGISLSYSFDNKIFHNDFVKNTEQVHSIGSTNHWDNGYPSGGNYWSDYDSVDYYSGPYQNETGNDGIGDTSYEIESNNTDHYPIMAPIAVPEFRSFLLPFLIATTLPAIIVGKAVNRRRNKPSIELH